MSVVEAIVDWSGGRPAWQRDALRRLVTRDELTADDWKELLALWKQERGVPSERELVARPLELAHLPADPAAEPPVRLVEISDVRNVNALTGDTALSVAEEGLTVVFGGNGTGKSGYVRILKHVCRARGEIQPVLGNVYDPDGEDAPAARLRYRVDDDLREYGWEQGDQPPDALRAVSIFDHACASVYTDERCDVAYLPYGLDLLPRLADVCRELRRRLDDEIKALDHRAVTVPEVPAESEAAELLERLDEEKVEDDLRRLAVFSDEDRDRLEELNTQLGADDPARRAQELEGRARRVRRLAQSLEAWCDGLADSRLEELKGLVRARAAAREAARIASEEAFAEEPVLGVGTEPWRALWEAARRFAEGIGPRGFPPGEGDPCLLCQNPVDARAATRMREFEAFVQGEVVVKRERAEAAVEELRKPWSALPDLSVGEFRGDLEMESEDLVEAVEEAIAALAERRETMLSADSADDLDGVRTLPTGGLIGRLSRIAEDLTSRGKEQRGVLDEEGRTQLEKERKGLEGRKRLAESREQLVEEIARRQLKRKLGEARVDADTRGITRRSTELTREAVSDVLAGGFRDELAALRLDHVPIEVAGFEGERGTAYHRVQLGAARLEVAPGRVLSQGEHRCVAIAAFIAELATQEADSTIVLDDPVSSLDHDRRDHVARRLVQLGARRPVLIFTHDIVFLAKLQQWSDDEGVELTARRLTQKGDRVGRVRDDWPWNGLSVRRRIGALRQKHQRAEALHREGRVDEYEALAKEIYGDLREAWERGVEEELLNGALVRFGPEVQTQRLSRLSSITDAHIEALDAGMSKSSRWLRGHDDPTAVDDPVPDPDEISEDIEQLDGWRKELHRLHEGH